MSPTSSALWAVPPDYSVLPCLVFPAPRTPPARCYLPPSATIHAVKSSVTSASPAIVPHNLGFCPRFPPPYCFTACRPLVGLISLSNILRLPTSVRRLLGVYPTLLRAPPLAFSVYTDPFPCPAPTQIPSSNLQNNYFISSVLKTRFQAGVAGFHASLHHLLWSRSTRLSASGTTVGRSDIFALRHICTILGKLRIASSF